MDSANKTDTVDICLVNMENRKIEALVMELDFDRLMVVALVADVAKLVAMGHFEVEVLPVVVVAVVLIVTLEFVDTFCSMGCKWEKKTKNIFRFTIASVVIRQFQFGNSI